MLRLSLARRSISREVQTPRRHLGFGSGLAAARSGQDIRYCSLPNYFLTANIQTTLPCGTLLSISALLRKHDRLDRERARILLLVVADDMRQLAFRDPQGIADLRHRDRLGEAILDGVDLGFVAFYRDLVEFAVPLDQQQTVAESAHRVRMIQRARSLQRSDGAGLAVLDGDLEQRGRDIRRDVEIAVRPERNAVEADTILCRR